MAGIEDLTPEQLRHLRYGELVLEAKDPKIVNAAKRLARQVQPDLRLPELDLEDQIEQERKKREEWEAKQEERAREDRVARRRAEEAQRSREAGFTPEEIEKIVVDEHCSFATALKLAAAQRDAGVPGAADVFAGGRSNITPDLRPDSDWRKLSPADQRRKGLSIAHEMMDEALRRQRGQRTGG